MRSMEPCRTSGSGEQAWLWFQFPERDSNWREHRSGGRHHLWHVSPPEAIGPHTGFFFLCNYASYSRFLYLLRTSPTYKSPNHLDRIDEVFQETLVSNHERRHPRRCLDPGNPPSQAWRPQPSSFVCSCSSLLPFIPYILLWVDL